MTFTLNRNRKALLTGASGFLGKYIFHALQETWNVDRLGRNEKVEIHCDLSSSVPHIDQSYEMVIHCAGKAHSVPRTDEERAEFFKVNVIGTQNLLQSLDAYGSEPSIIVYISTVAVYGLVDGNKIAEDHPLKGLDAYARSKIDAEAILTDWCKKKNIPLIILRLPLIWGLHAPGNLGAMRKAMNKEMYFSIGKGKARKSIVHPADVADLIANTPLTSGVYNLTDGHHPTFREIENVMASHVGKKVRSMPYVLALLLAWFGDLLAIVGINFPLNSDRLKKMTSDLTFDDNLARQTIGWNGGYFIERDGV